MENAKTLPNNKEKNGVNSLYAEYWRRYKKNKAAMLGLVIFAMLVLVIIFADVIVPYEKAIDQDYTQRFLTPCAEHWFGTDHFGRDVFARVIHGSRYSLIIGVVTNILSLVLGGLLGAAAGYYGGKVDDTIMRIMDVFMCIPFMLLALAIVAALGPGLVNLMIAITISSIPGMTRLVRSAVLLVADQDYIEAAGSYGSKDARILLKYIIPNALGPIIVNTTMNIAGTILAAAGLSFIGMGIQPPTPEWGAMLSGAREYMRQAPYLMVYPGLAILLSVLSLNLIGDGLRDALDPKLKD